MFIKKCESCQCDIQYKTKSSLNRGIKNKTKCSKCKSNSIKSLSEEERKKKFGKSGEKNSMYGKTFYEVWINKYGKDEADKKLNDFKNKCSVTSNNWIKSLTEDERKKIHGSQGKKNPMYGKTIYQAWTNKYGKDEADKRLNDFKNKISESTSGEKNPMYGKPSPQGSGNGWSGWYNGFFFRSLIELSYLVYLNRFKINYKNGEFVKIQYQDYLGNNKNYFPDLIIENKYLVEIKPRSLIKSKTVEFKTEAGKKWSQANGFIYKIISPKKISFEKIKKLHDSNEIIFTKRYEEKFKCFKNKKK